ncbi:MAG: HrgA protein [Mesorhizobium sp.]|uniref:COG2958 family protein n=1 Tax=Mesorhizobium sp. TaxID=1871066 RepID=UPI000FE4CA1E|nr:HrgA protein [Mesorhizobium sp.]RWI30847.1 MAG: HrgA protein [Mesorhizobium sp.]TIO54408.1 MAG: HrgA protein [Mesorhizobium sp.]TIO58822.1 MAG: HrgA protein [Mesorhizobium sp.]TJV61747.1 MAG: HrgA protein [Mesorhizobium sp.]
MSAKLDLKRRVVELLSANPEKRFKARDVAIWVTEKYPEAAAAKMQKSGFIENQAQLLNQIVAEIASNRPQWQKQLPQLRTTDGVRPRLFYWTEKSEAEEVADVESGRDLFVEFGKPTEEAAEPTAAVIEKTVARRSEHDLYPMLIEFMESEHNVRGQRIDEKKSSNKYGSGGNKWLFPDVVGMENLTDGLHPEVVTAIRESRDTRIRLWSFEVKLLINRSNARETYFQAVSNSSWANFGYLVAANFEGADTMKELRILYAMHGIGLIRLDEENPAESQVLVPARERPDLEWAMCSRLAVENKDFQQFMTKVRQFFQTGDM